MAANHSSQVRSDRSLSYTDLFVRARRVQFTPFTSKRKRVALPASFQAQRQIQKQRWGLQGFAHSRLNASPSSTRTASQIYGDTELIPVRIRTKHTVSFGEIIRTVGAGLPLGDWNADRAPGMSWSEGDEWAVDLDVPPGCYNFKCVVTREDGSIAEWEPGENRSFEVPDPEQLPGQVLEVVCPWSNTSATFLSFDEDDAAARLENERGEGVQASAGNDHQRNPAADTLSSGLSDLDGSGSSSDQDIEATVEAVADALQTAESESESYSPVSNHTELLDENLDRQAQESQAISAPDNGSQLPTESPPDRPPLAQEDPTPAQEVPTPAQQNSKPQESPTPTSATETRDKTFPATETRGKVSQVDDNLQVASSSTNRSSEATNTDLRGVQDSNDVPPPSTGDQEGRGTFAQGFLAFLGLLAVPIVLFSEYTLNRTGCGLPPGPSGYIGAAEGVSYLAVLGVAASGFFSRALGKGFPRGPGGLLGAAEGLSYAAVVLGTVVLGVQYKEHGYIPSALPDANCFGDEDSRGEDLFSIFTFGDDMDVGETMSNAVKSIQNVFMNGPESSMEYVASGAEDGLSSAELEPVVEELERAVARFGDWLTNMKQRLTPTPVAFSLSTFSGHHLPALSSAPPLSTSSGEREWDVAVSPADWESIQMAPDSDHTDSQSPLRLVGMEMSFNVAASNAASAANNVTQNINNEVLQLDSAATSLAENSKRLAEFPAEDHAAQQTGDGVHDALQQVEGSSGRLEPMIQQLQATADELRPDSGNSARVEALDKASESLTKAVNLESKHVPMAKPLGERGEDLAVKSTDEAKDSSHTDSALAHVSSIQMYLEQAVDVLGNLAAKEESSVKDQDLP